MDAFQVLLARRDLATLVYMTLGYFLPLLLYAGWTALAFAELARAPGSAGRVWGWTLAIFGLPFIGAGLFLALNGSGLSRALRTSVLAVGPGLVVIGYLLTLFVLH